MNFKNSKILGVGEILISVFIAIIAFFISPLFSESFKEWSYLGFFIFSLVSSATLFIPISSTLLVIAIAKDFNPILLGLSVGIGSAIGELTGFFAGKGGNILLKEKFPFFDQYKDLIKKADIPFLFLVSFIPNPFFDIAGITAGLLNISIWRFLLPVMLGKSLRFILIAMLELHILNYF